MGLNFDTKIQSKCIFTAKAIGWIIERDSGRDDYFVSKMQKPPFDVSFNAFAQHHKKERLRVDILGYWKKNDVKRYEVIIQEGV